MPDPNALNGQGRCVCAPGGSMPLKEVRKMVEFAVEKARSTTPENMADEAVVQWTMRHSLPAWKAHSPS